MKLRLAVILICLGTLLTACVTETTGSNREANPEKLIQDLLNLGVGYIREGEYARAKEKLTKALALDPNLVQAHNAFGRLFELEGEDELAEEHFKRALSLDPKFSPARNTYGAFLYAQGRYIEAVEQLQFAVDDRLYQYRAAAFENLGVSHLKLDQANEAAKAFKRSIQLNPRQSRALLEMSEITFNQQDYVLAKQFYQRHLRVAKTSSRSLWMCIRLAKVFNERDEEASCALTLSNIFPNTEAFRKFQASKHL